MKVLAEKEAEEFLEKKGFPIAKRIFVKDFDGCLKAAKKISFPLVLKIASKKILHKSDVNGVRVNIKDEKELEKAFNELKKIKNFEGVMVQEYI